MRIILTLLCLVMFSCTTKKKAPHIAKEIEESPMMKRVGSKFQVIDVDRSLKVKMDFIIPKLVSISYIPLESTELIGAMDQVLVHDGKIYIMDAYITERVFIFDMQGRALKVIDDKGEGPTEYTGLSGMCIDSEKKEICLNDRLSAGKLYYDLNGQFLRKEKGIPCFYINELGYYAINQLGYAQSFSNHINYHLVCTVQDSICSKGFPYEPIQEQNMMSMNAMFNSMGDLLFTPILSDTVYSIKSFEEYSVRYIIKHDRSVWAKRREKLSYNEVNDLIRNSGYTAFKGSFYETAKYVYFSMNKKFEKFVGINYFLLDKADMQVYELNGINLDMLEEVIPPNLIALNGEICIASFDAYLIKEALAKKDNGGVIKNDTLKSIIENSNESSNPVLVMYQLK